MDGADQPWTRSTCPYWGVGCGVLLRRDGDGGLEVKGDDAHPANLGRLCSKGTALAETVGLDHRLLRPRVNGQDAGWDDAPGAVGALLMLLRMKGETAEEIAGFAEAASSSAPALPPADLDWPSYAAGRTRGQPWFLLSARLVTDAGHRVLLHGWNGPDRKVRDGLAEAGIGLAGDPEDAARLLDRDRIAYMPLKSLHPGLFRLLNLRDVLGLRSCVNTVCRMLNPARAAASVQGVFHPFYRQLQADAAMHLGWQALSIIKGAGGEFESNPAKDITAFGLRQGRPWQETRPVLRDETRKLNAEGDLALSDLWQGLRRPPFETDLVVTTTALALDTLGHANAVRQADLLWQNRARRCAA